MHYLVAKTLADELTANWRGKENDKKGLYRKRWNLPSFCKSPISAPYYTDSANWAAPPPKTIIVIMIITFN